MKPSSLIRGRAAEDGSPTVERVTRARGFADRNRRQTAARAAPSDCVQRNTPSAACVSRCLFYPNRAGYCESPIRLGPLAGGGYTEPEAPRAWGILGMLEKIVSGGQTGVDRAALDTAMALGIVCGGWCPRGRRAADGPISASYPLRETASEDYAERTRLNVRDSDATLILSAGPLSGGTGYTAEIARALGRPFLVCDPGQRGEVSRALRWLEDHRIRVLNVAGPREAEHARIYGQARDWMEAFLRVLLRLDSRGGLG